MRPAKSLLAHVEAGTFGPGRHGHLLATGTLPKTSPAASPACRRIWKKLRALLDEYTRLAGTEFRRDIADEFSQLANEYVGAPDRALPHPGDVIPGLREILAINRWARKQYERERADATRG
jgi:hypothetical protein